MSAFVITGAMVSVYADQEDGLGELIDRALVGTPFRLSGLEPGPVGGTVSCRFDLARPVVIGSANLVDLQYRLQRQFELHDFCRLTDPIAVAA